MSSSIGFRGVGLAVAFLSIAGAASLRADEIGAARAPAVRLAQSGLPPADIPGAADEGAGDPAGLLVKIERLESQLRMANGQIEELQNQQRQLEDQLKRFREDMEFRLGQLSGAQPPTGAQPPAAVSTPQPTKPKKPPASDAFDPSTAAPNAPGAPLQLGKTSPSPPLAEPAAPQPLPPPAAEGPPVIQGVGPSDDPREVFKTAMEAYGHDQYDQAEQQFRAFVAKYPKDRSAADAVYYLGETYLKRNRMREAAEQYLRLSTDYAKSPLAPNAMVRLAQSLSALDNNPQACATLGEIDRRYPNATAALKRVVESEIRRDHC